VEAAGVEPASGSVTGEATPCSASSWFSPRRLEKRQNGVGATPNSFRPSVRGTGGATPAFRDVGRGAAGALHAKRGYLIKQPERSCCCSQLLFPTFLARTVRTSACNLSRHRPRRSRFAPNVYRCAMQPTQRAPSKNRGKKRNTRSSPFLPWPLDTLRRLGIQSPAWRRSATSSWWWSPRSGRRSRPSTSRTP
jgi:hypothetical protein